MRSCKEESSRWLMSFVCEKWLEGLTNRVDCWCYVLNFDPTKNFTSLYLQFDLLLLRLMLYIDLCLLQGIFCQWTKSKFVQKSEKNRVFQHNTKYVVKVYKIQMIINWTFHSNSIPTLRIDWIQVFFFILNSRVWKRFSFHR